MLVIHVLETGAETDQTRSDFIWSFPYDQIFILIIVNALSLLLIKV